MVYQYVACNEGGEIVKGKLSAANEESATDLLSYAGYRLINLKPFVPFFSLDKISTRFSQIKSADIILFFRQLALLLESGINITIALELLQDQASNHSFKKVLSEVTSDIRSGNQLSVALGKHPGIFSTICCRSMSVGEQTGGIETMLRQIADYMEKEIVARKDIKSALTYPVIALVVTVIMIGVMVVFVLPAFSNLYDSLGAELPAMTRLLLDFSGMFRSNIIYIMLALLIGGGSAFAYMRTAEGKYKWHKLALKLPLVGPVNHLNELARVCRNISQLFHAGLPLTEIMPLVIQGSENKVIANALADVQQGMLKGEGLSRPMSKNAIFLPMMVQMVKVGEETGNLDTSLFAVAQNYEAEVQDKTRALIALIQPVMTLGIAVVVGFIALSLVSAMYSVYGQSF